MNLTNSQKRKCESLKILPTGRCGGGLFFQCVAIARAYAVLLATRVIIMNARPGRIIDEINIDLQYPRNQATKLTPESSKHRNYIMGHSL